MLFRTARARARVRVRVRVRVRADPRLAGPRRRPGKCTPA